MIAPEHLACPCCRRPLSLDPITPPRGRFDVFGVLTSPCGRSYPVVDGIPIFTPEVAHLGAIGEDESIPAIPTAQVLDRVRAGEDMTVLADLLAVPWCPWPLNRLPIVRRLLTSGLIGRLNVLLRTTSLRRRLRQADPGTAQEWLGRFHDSGAVGGSDAYAYFLYRFAQPRHLAALSMLATLRDDDRPVIDIACGYGHLTHFLTHHRPTGGSIGIDVNFSQVWVARHVIAPGAAFICADACAPLPLRDGVAAAVICSDAFHYLPDPHSRLREFTRCTAEGLIMLPRFGNLLVAPNEGHEHDPEAWEQILGRFGTVRLREEDVLVTDYLSATGPRLADHTPAESLHAAKWLYAVIDPTGTTLIDHPPPRSSPHLTGELGINPIYRPTRTPQGHRLRFTWPSSWYAFENARMADYHAAHVTLDGQLSDPNPDQVQRLIDQFVLIGLPRRYMTSLHRRPTERARMLVRQVRDLIAGPPQY